MKNFNEFINESANDELRSRVKEYMGRVQDWFEFPYQDSGNYIEIYSREYGDVMNESPGKQDIQKGREIARKLREEFADELDSGQIKSVEVEAIGETISVFVTFPR